MSFIVMDIASGLKVVPFKRIASIHTSKSEMSESQCRYSVSLTAEGEYAEKIYNETGDESVVKEGEKLVRDILNGMATNEVVNISEFPLEPVKPPPAKRAPAKKPAA